MSAVVETSHALVTVASMKMKSFVLASLVAETVPVMKTTKNPYLSIQVDDQMMRVVAGDDTTLFTTTTPLVAVGTSGKFNLLGRKLDGIASRADGQEVAICVVGSMATIESESQRWTLPASPGLLHVTVLPTPDVYSAVQVEHLAEACRRLRVAGGMSKLTVEPSVQIGDGVAQVTAGSLHHQETLPGLTTPPCRLAWSHFLLLEQVLGAGAIAEGEFAKVGFDHTGMHIWSPVCHLRLSATADDMTVEPPISKALTNEAVLQVDRLDLLDAVQSVTVHLSGESPAVQLSLTSNKLVVTAQDSHGHSGRQELSVHWQFPETVAQVRATAMLHMLRAHKGPACEFRLAAESGQTNPPWLLMGKNRLSVLKQWA